MKKNSRHKSKWYVIVGGPSSGKTTLLKELKKRGFRTVEEIARSILERELEKGRTPEEVRKNDLEFQREILQIKLMRDRSLPKNILTFFDTGLPDSIAYMIANGDIRMDEVESSNFEITEASEALQVARNIGYKKVFLLEQLPYEKDGIRIEDEKKAREVGRALRKLYEFLGCEIVDVPAMPLKKRVEFILSHVEK